ncbi:MAG: hypothetical protein LBO75_05080, partial [Bifidobacteriaceae bacterium]|nr:hypothetical protein [Bifidobacteriaceae bacterium]
TTALATGEFFGLVVGFAGLTAGIEAVTGGLAGRGDPPVAVAALGLVRKAGLGEVCWDDADATEV